MDLLTPIVAPLVAPAQAQSLARLHVRSFTLSVDPASLRIGETLRLRIVAQLDENVLQLDNVTLPDLSAFESLGDERRCATAGHGSECVEVMTLAPTTPGTFAIGPAALEAIDARNGRPSRFATNVVRVTVAPGANTVAQTLVDGLLRPLALLLVGGAIAFAVIWAAGRRARRTPRTLAVVSSPPAAPVPTPPPPQPPALLVLARELEANPTRANVMSVRAELRRQTGAGERDTLGDLLSREPARSNPTLREALRAVEFAAFSEDSELAAAAARALQPVYALCGVQGVTAG